MSGVNVLPSLVTLPDVELLKLNLLRELTELGGWFNELLLVAAEVVLLGWVVEVISEPMEARPLSELALQFPLEEFGSSLFPCRRRRCSELSRSFTAIFITEDKVAAGTDFSELDIEEFLSCVLRSLSKSLLLFIVTVSYRLKSSKPSSAEATRLLCPPELVSLFSTLLLRNFSYWLLPHCFKLLKRDIFTSGDSFLPPLERSKSLLLLRGTVAGTFRASSRAVLSGDGRSALGKGLLECVCCVVSSGVEKLLSVIRAVEFEFFQLTKSKASFLKRRKEGIARPGRPYVYNSLTNELKLINSASGSNSKAQLNTVSPRPN
ncbi:hypothetical protein HUJ04_006255 [Dendroctonus ponderosae]|nr:hypothetical protein HUJ04_006255 [Dendroctonus ponderosae]